MQIVRFDEEMSIPVGPFGSRRRICPLAGVREGSEVSVMYLAPGGGVGRYEGTVPRLLLVVAGSGWVRGGDDRERSLGRGYGALFAAGESHEMGTASGLTALCIEGAFETLATKVTQEIVVVDYDERWPEWFERVRSFVWPAVEGIALVMEHVGSTSVPGLAAKPVIDADIVVASEDLVSGAVEALAAIGYRWLGDLGVPGRQAFEQPREAAVPPHHLYVVARDNKAHVDHWLLRDTLIAHPDLQAQYAALKRRNRDLAEEDMEFYVAAKAAFVAELLTHARSERGLPVEEYWDPDLEIPFER